MGIKENFKQAAQELLHMPATADGGADAEKPLDTPGAVELTAEQKRAGRPQRAEPVPERKTVPAPPPARRQHTIIAEGDEVRGDLRCIGDFELYGTLVGNITGSGSLKLCGTLTGDAEGATAEVRGGCIQGNLSLSHRVEVDSNSVVLGDIKAQSLTLGGKVRGNLDIAESLTLAETAAVLGKISTGRLSVAEGAVFQSEVTIPTADFDSLFQKAERSKK